MVVRQAGQARLVAEELDGYGNPTPLFVSPPFSAGPLSACPAVDGREGGAQAARQAHGVSRLDGRRGWRGLIRGVVVATGQRDARARRSGIIVGTSCCEAGMKWSL